jgi:dihydrodiol dehydrogenase / D-xylose 1-dehydrogenase (NADP)
MSTSSSRPTRWGVLGAGEISHDWTIAVSTLPKDEHQVVSVAARSVDRARKFAEIHKIPKVHNSYEDLVKDPEIGQ